VFLQVFIETGIVSLIGKIFQDSQKCSSTDCKMGEIYMNDGDYTDNPAASKVWHNP
jgi:hypothetical protein